MPDKELTDITDSACGHLDSIIQCLENIKTLSENMDKPTIECKCGRISVDNNETFLVCECGNVLIYSDGNHDPCVGCGGKRTCYCSKEDEC